MTYNVVHLDELESIPVGDREGALDALERAAELDAERVRKLAEGDSDLDSIRDDPRFGQLLSL